MYSHTISSFHKVKILTSENKLMKPVFQHHSFEIFQFLDESDLKRIKCTNKFLYEICECHLLLTQSIRGLQSLFLNSLVEEPVKKEIKEKKNSKFKERFNFNKSMNEFYKGSEVLEKRIQSGKKMK